MNDDVKAPAPRPMTNHSQPTPFHLSHTPNTKILLTLASLAPTPTPLTYNPAQTLLRPVSEYIHLCHHS